MIAWRSCDVWRGVLPLAAVLLAGSQLPATALAELSETDSAEALCTADCNADGSVTVDEILVGVNIDLGTARLASCPAADRDGDRRVTIDELIDAVRSAVFGCLPHTTPTSTPTPRSFATRTPIPTRTPAASGGPPISFFGVARADATLIDASGNTASGLPLYTLPFGSGFFIVVEGGRSPSGRVTGDSAYDQSLADFPDLQVEVSRPLGDGSAAVCDVPQHLPDGTTIPGGGVPAVDPPSFDPTTTNVATVNDLACRFRDGAGAPIGRLRDSACVLFPSGLYDFVGTDTTIQFCGFVDHSILFPDGDTVVSVRLRDTNGVLSPVAQLVVRVLGLPTPTPTPFRSTPTATATRSSGPSVGPVVSFFGLVRSDNMLLQPDEFSPDGIPIYTRAAGTGFSLVVEGRPGASQAPVGLSSFEDDSTFPDLQVQVTRALGNGSIAVCDIALPMPGVTPGPSGGVPGVDPPDFTPTESVIGVVNDLACRFRNGTGSPVGRTRSEACVLFRSGLYDFVESSSTVQFCGVINASLQFQQGDTLVTVRLRDQQGNIGLPAQLIVRVE